MNSRDFELRLLGEYVTIDTLGAFKLARGLISHTERVLRIHLARGQIHELPGLVDGPIELVSRHEQRSKEIVHLRRPRVEPHYFFQFGLSLRIAVLAEQYSPQLLACLGFARKILQ